MARAKSNGNGRLEDSLNALVQAQALLVQNQAAYLSQKAESDKRFGEFEREMTDLKREGLKLEKDLFDIQRANLQRFERIEAILLEHNRILKSLPDLIGEKIGFKPPAPSQ